MLKKVLIERNYRTLAVEANANEKAYIQYLKIMEEDNINLNSERDIEAGEMSTGRYIVIGDSRAGRKYNIKLQEKEDVAVEILDDIICNQKIIEMLKLYPILQKEYNMNGTKKLTSELMQNMLSEIKSILGNKEISEEEQKLIIEDTKFMYYELIYNSLKRITPEEILKIEQQIGKEKSIKIFNNMQQYFQKEMERKIEDATKMASAQEKLEKFIAPSNDGTIEIEENGKRISITIDDFIKTIDPKLLERKIINPYNKKEMSGEEFIKIECRRFLPQNGEMILKDGNNISAKQYVEQYMLQIDQYNNKDYTLYKQLEDNVQSQDPWTIQKETKERLTRYYEAKIQLIGEVVDRVNDNKENKMLGEE